MEGVAPIVSDEFRALLKSTEVLADAPKCEGEGKPPAFVATHHGNFHCDEVMACVMLKLLSQFQELPIVRTRDGTLIAQATIVVDVGGEYDVSKARFDHHQREFCSTWSEKYPLVKLSSAGLVFKHFGSQVIRAICEMHSITLLEAEVDVLVLKVYHNLMRELDAVDNGVEVAEGELRYIYSTGLSSRINRLNPSWQQVVTPELENASFKQALQVAAAELFETVVGLAREWLPARSIVESSKATAKTVHPSGEILKLTQFCPSAEHLFDLEEESGEFGFTKYVLFCDSRGGWRVQAVNKDRGSFDLRRGLPAAWRGLRDSDLSEKAGIPDCVFVHAGGFIGGNNNEEGALKMAIKALQE